MDEVNARIQPQNSVCSTSSGEDHPRNEQPQKDAEKRRICLVGAAASDSSISAAAETFDVPVVTSGDGLDVVRDETCDTVFVLDSFEGDTYNNLYSKIKCKEKTLLLGTVALRQLAKKNQKLPYNVRPLFSLAMSGVAVCFSKFRDIDRDQLARLVLLIHQMGGSVRKNMNTKVTHLISNFCGGDKYQYAFAFRVPVMNLNWVYSSWEKRHDVDFSATLDVFVSEFKLKPFHGARVCFVGFPEDEERHMSEVLISNGGNVTSIEDPNCTHVVTDSAEVYTLETAKALMPSKSAQPEVTTPRNAAYHYANSQNPTLSSRTARSSVHLETVHEDPNLRASNGCLSEVDSTFFDRSIDLSDGELSSSKRKRKYESPDDASLSRIIKRKRDKSQSERKKKVSEFFKTPINYFSNRRRTIDSASFDCTLNESILSSSGVFNVETVQNLSSASSMTPVGAEKKRKSIFSRTFSSSKFLRTKPKKLDLNATKLSFSEHSEIDGFEKLNSSCFPDFSLNRVPCPSNSELGGKDFRRSSLASSSVAVVDESAVAERPEVPSRAWIVKAEWFWTSVQKELCLDEKEYLFDDYIKQVVSPTTRRNSHQVTPSSASKRKRRLETISSLAHTQQSPSVHKRRSSVSDAGLLSLSGSFLDCTASPDKTLLEGPEPAIDTPRKGVSPRQQVFLELVQTESNYVAILHTIMTMFKQHLEDMPEEEALLNNMELKLIFGKLPPIYETHIKMLDALKHASLHWNEEVRIGELILKFSTDLLRSYPPFINFFEEMKEVLTQCDQNKPRFHAFLKACQTRPECGRQSLQELMIRPVQRLGSICLLLNDILKNTQKKNPDHLALEQALASLREVMKHINEDKRRAEGQVTLFNIFNDIDNCPPDIVSSHRSFIARTEVIQLSSSEGLSHKGNNLVLFLFSDQLEVCKRKSKYLNSLKSPSSTGGSLGGRSLVKPYKHIKLLPLNSVKRVIDITETDDCQRVFVLVCRHSDELKERFYSFAMAEEGADKTAFVKTLVRQMANNACTADADKFLAYLEPSQLDLDTSDLSNGTFSRAVKFATKTRLRVERAFSFNKTPSKLKRAVSSMMSPFGSSTNLTPSSQLANMRLASYNNISELGNAENSSDNQPLTAPLSVQPTRKVKASSFAAKTMKRL